MNKKILLMVIALLFCTASVYGQFGRFHPSGDKKEVLMQLRNLELLKALDLNDEESMRVLPIIKDIDKLMESSFESHMKITKDLDTALSNNNKKQISKNIDLLLAQVTELGKERSKLYKKLRDELGEEKFGRYLLFMQRFGRDLQDKLRMIKDGERFKNPPEPKKNK